MARKKAKRVFRQETVAETQRMKKLRQQIKTDLPKMMAEGRQIKEAHEAASHVIAELRAERERQGLSLADVKALTGINREAISKLENDKAPNPTVRTLVRYAQAVGCDLQLLLAKTVR